MSRSAAKAWLDARGWGSRVIVMETSTATVALAAAALGCEPRQIAKTMALEGEDDEHPILVLAAGDAKLSSSLFKKQFGRKAKMIAPADVERIVGHAPGGVCPFGVVPGASVWLDRSLHALETVYPACGDDRTGVRLSPEELFEAAGAQGWVEVTKATGPSVREA